MILKYSPRRPYEFCQYILENLPPNSYQVPAVSSKPKDTFVNDTCRQAVTSQAVVGAKIRQFARASLQKAVHDSGGIANLLFVFAKVVTFLSGFHVFTLRSILCSLSYLVHIAFILKFDGC